MTRAKEKQQQVKEEREKQLKVKNFQPRLEQFRSKNIPKQYNQIKLLNELANEDVDHYISISNRTDGKSWNYIHALLNIAIDYDLGLTLLSRNMMLRTSYQDLITDILEGSKTLNKADFQFIRGHYYVRLQYKKRTIAILTDLNNATQLKNFSNFLKNFPLIVYDEFIALESEYLPDEWERLKTIYESIDRVETYPLIHKPKIFYLGNAVNFESPVLHGLKIFNILEHHPMNTAKIYKYDFNIMLEINRNENANKKRNTRAFASEQDAMTTGEFETNAHHIATENDRNAVLKNPRTVFVKLKQNYLKIWYNPDTYDIILSIEAFTNEPYQYNLQLKDNKEESEFLNESYFSENHIKRIDRGRYLFANNFSRNYITTDFGGLSHLKIHKIIREQLRHESIEYEREQKEKQFKVNYINETKKAMMRKIWGE